MYMRYLNYKLVVANWNYCMKLKTPRYNLEFEVLAVMVIKSFSFWDITLCSLLKDNRRFVGACRHYFQN
jgi:hypothetical protein